MPPTIEDSRNLEKSKAYATKAALIEVVGKGYDYVISTIEPDRCRERLIARNY